MLINGTIEMQFNCGNKLGKIIKFLDEYSFSIYLGNMTIMLFSRIHEQLGFGKVKLAIFDFVGCFIFIHIFHEMIKKPSSRRLKTR